MTSTADHRGWGNPSTASFDASITKVTAGGVSVHVHRNVAPVFSYLLTELGRHYNLKGYADDWGYCYRPIRGYEDRWKRTHDLKYLSNHSWGLAVDLDSSVNPMTSDLKAQHEFIREVVNPILAPFHGRLVWGGEYATARKDYMHFEYVGTKAEAPADCATAQRLLRPPPAFHAETAHPPTPIPTLEPDMVVIYAPGKPLALLAAGKLTALQSNAEKDALVAAGVPFKQITADQFSLIQKVATR